MPSFNSQWNRNARCEVKTWLSCLSLDILFLGCHVCPHTGGRAVSSGIRMSVSKSLQCLEAWLSALYISRGCAVSYCSLGFLVP